MGYKSEIYPNQPLVEVVFEIRFPGEVKVECERHLFWERIRGEYPSVSVPHPRPDKPMALVPYKFSREDGNMTVMISMNSLAVSSKLYPGYPTFKKEALKIYGDFTKVFKLENITRIGWRYINVIPFVRENGIIPITRFLNFGFENPKSISGEFKNINLFFESGSEDESVITKLQAMQNSNSGSDNEAMLLDIDYGKVTTETTQLKFKDVPQYLEEAHIKTRQIFEEFITEEYRQYLRGDVI